MQRRSLLLAAGAAAALPFIGRPVWAQAGNVTGAGSSLTRRVMQKWAEMAGPGASLRVAYEGNGSTEGLERVKQRTVDFANVDFAQRSALVRENQLIQFPVVIAGVVPFVNLPGVADGQIRLTGELLADIYLGKVTKWNDAKIKAHNSGVQLPDLAVLPVHSPRSSGTTMLFTTYLARASEAWAAGPRAGAVVQWPANVGASVGGQDDLIAKMKGTPGAIGYGSVGRAKEHKFASVSLRNRAGEFIKPDAASFAKAGEGADWNATGFAVDMVDGETGGAWPICGASFVLVPENPTAEKVEAARHTLKFFHWALKNGAGVANELENPPVPQGVHARIMEAWRRAKDPSGRPIWEA